MKKALSFVLILCMLLCMVPVVSASADTQPGNDAEAAYEDLYVQDGLQAVFATENIDLSAGKWYAIVPDGQGGLAKSDSVYATVGGGVYNAASNPTGWQQADDGSIFYTDSGFTAGNSKIVFPTSLLSDDFTVTTEMKITLRNTPRETLTVAGGTPVAKEGGLQTFTFSGFTQWHFGAYVSPVEVKYSGTAGTVFKPAVVYSAPVDGQSAGTPPAEEITEITLDENGKSTAKYSYLNGGKVEITVPEGVTVESVTAPYYTSANEAGVDDYIAIGNIYGFLWSNLSGTNGWNNGYGATRFYISNKRWNDGGSSDYPANYGVGFSGNDNSVFKNVNKVTSTLTVTRKKNDNGSHTGTIYMNHASIGSGTATNATALNNHIFQLFHNVPTQVWDVLVYDRVLSVAEFKQNHLVDIAKNAGADVSVLTALSAEEKAALAETLANVSVGSLTKDALETLCNASGSLYVTDGLTVLMGAYPQFSTVNMEAKKWYNVALGKEAHDAATLSAIGAATFKGSVWQQYENGVGFDLTSPTYARENELTLNSLMFPETGDMTFELITELRTESVTRDYHEEAVVRLGYLVYVMVTADHSADRWYLSNSSSLGTWNGSSGWTKDLFGFTQNDFTGDKKFSLTTGVQSFTITRDEAADTNTAAVVISTNRATNTSFTLKKSSATWHEEDGGYYTYTKWPYPVEGETSKTAYNTIPNFLFNGMPNTTYAIRVYDRLLTENEKAQNHFADVAYYLDLDLTAFRAMSEGQKAQIYQVFATFSFDSDKEQAQAILDGSNIFAPSAYDVLYVGADGSETENGGHLTGSFSAFGGESNLINSYWINKAPDAVGVITFNGTWTAGIDNGNGIGYPTGERSRSMTPDKSLLPGGDYTIDYLVKYNERVPGGNDSSIVIGYWRDSLAAYASNYSYSIRWIMADTTGTNAWENSSCWSGRAAADGYGDYNYNVNTGRPIGTVFSQQFTRDMNDTFTGATTKVYDNMKALVTTVRTQGSTGNKAFLSKGAVINGITITHSEDELPFFFFYNTPATVYSFRIYDAVLTEAEMARNHFVDLMGYYGVDASLYAGLTDNMKSRVDAAFKAVTVADTNKDAIEESLQEFPSFTYATVSLGGEFGLNFYVSDKSDMLAENAFVAYYVDGVRVKTGTKIEKKDDTTYKLSVYLPARMMQTDVTMKIVSEDGKTVFAEATYSIAKYASYVIAHKAEDAYKDAAALMEAMLNLGAYAELYTGSASTSLPTFATMDVTADEVLAKTSKYSAVGDLTGIKNNASSLIFDGTITMRHYFTVSEGSISDYTFTYNGKKLAVQEKSGKYFVDIAGIMPGEYADALELTVSKGGAMQTVSYGVYTYVYEMIKGESVKTSMKNLAKALYYYGEAVAEYTK